MLETTRLIFGPFQEFDVEAAHSWFRDPDVFRFNTYGPYSSLDETTERIGGTSLTSTNESDGMLYERALAR